MAIKWDPELCAQLIDHMADGGSYEAFSAKLGCSRNTLYTWEKSHPEWKEAKEIAFAKCQLWWEEQGKIGLWNENFGQGQGSKTMNAAIWIFNMRNRFGWRNADPDPKAKEQDLTPQVTLSDEQLVNLSKKLREKKK